MASRDTQKEEARARRLAEEQAQTERARRTRRLQLIGGTVAVAIVIVVVLVVISSGGAKKAPGLAKPGAEQNATVTAVDQLLAGIPQSGTVLGQPKATVTMFYFGDYECPICRDFTLEGGFPQLVSGDVRAGTVKVEYKSFCTATCNGPNPGIFNEQQAAGLAAGEQNKFWQYTELFYREQGQEDTGYVTAAYLEGLAQQVTGLDFATWQGARTNTSLYDQVNSDQADARELGISGTPTLVFQGPKGQTAATGVISYAQIQSAIKQVS
jgi:protein-disulfide isomerase